MLISRISSNGTIFVILNGTEANTMYFGINNKEFCRTVTRFIVEFFESCKRVKTSSYVGSWVIGFESRRRRMDEMSMTSTSAADFDSRKQE